MGCIATCPGNLSTIRRSLTILGDPTVFPGRLCTVNFRLPTTLADPRQPVRSRGTDADIPLHYTSGVYFIESVTHTVSVGIYTTTLNLRREAQSNQVSPVQHT